MTIVNPYTILFWASIGSQITLIALSNSQTHSILAMGLGVIIGTVGWVVCLNMLLHITRHKFSKKTILRLNYTGALILLGFAAVGILRVLNIMQF